jgi:hypothetical protein
MVQGVQSEQVEQSRRVILEVDEAVGRKQLLVMLNQADRFLVHIISIDTLRGCVYVLLQQAREQSELGPQRLLDPSDEPLLHLEQYAFAV